jgi:predicted glycosyltransferase involved in capsule biosynthesis
MKQDATDITFMILARLDSIARLENVIASASALLQHFNTTVYVLEADRYCNNVLHTMLGNKVRYEFVEDDDPILHKTRYFNLMMQKIETPFVSIWDADTIVEKDAIIECLDKLRKGEADIALPYNGVCLDTSDILRKIYFMKQDIEVFKCNIGKMDRLYNRILTGGAVLMNRQKFISIGGENEVYYGWGDDDYDRYIRFMNHGMKIYRSKSVLFHLSHPRGENSGFNTELRQRISKGELYKTQNRIK